MKIIDNLKKEIDEIHGVILVMEDVIKGFSTPCELCVGCEVEDGRKGVCECFNLKGRNEE